MKVFRVNLTEAQREVVIYALQTRQDYIKGLCRKSCPPHLVKEIERQRQAVAEAMHILKEKAEEVELDAEGNIVEESGKPLPAPQYNPIKIPLTHQRRGSKLFP